jgi:hypothetical protein
VIHYHGTPCGATREDVARFLAGRHALIPWNRPEDIGTAAEVCQSFCIDNGAYGAWKSGTPVQNWKPYFEFVKLWHQHPGYDFCIIPDVIDGTESDNDLLIAKFINWDGWRGRSHWHHAVPVWHLHESLERRHKLCRGFERIAFGSSGDFATPGTTNWHRRMGEAMTVVCDENNQPRCKLHGLRMLDAAIFSQYPLASADSTNAVRNSSSFRRFGMYCPPKASTRMAIIAERIEAHNSAAIWQEPHEYHLTFTLTAADSQE